MRKLLREEDLEELLEQSEAEPRSRSSDGTKQPTAVDKTSSSRRRRGNRAVTAETATALGRAGLAARRALQPSGRRSRS